MSAAREAAIVAFFEAFHVDFAPLLDKVWDAGYRAAVEEAAAAPAEPLAPLVETKLPPAWTEDRDDILIDGWVGWVPQDAILERLNALPGEPIQARDLFPRTVELRCARNVEYSDACRAIWLSWQKSGNGWGGAIQAIHSHIAQQDEIKRTAKRTAMAENLARTDAALPPPAKKRNGRHPLILTDERRVLVLREWAAGTPRAEVLEQFNALPGNKIDGYKLSVLAGYLQVKRPPGFIPPSNKPPAAPAKPPAPPPAPVVAAAPPAPIHVLPAPGPDGKIRAPLPTLIAWSREVGFQGFDGSNVDALNRWCVARLKPSVVVEW